MIKRIIALLVISLLITACSKPLPADKLNYAGHWQSPEMTLLILADGTASYKRTKKGVNVSVDGPIKEFIGKDFVVGFAALTTTFEVTEGPHQVDGEWQMVVDGVRLRKGE
ncbi:MAG: hypothetical protein KUG78_13230 [Kangiellaceae bacterium]|nr:hypothetical protein [Kangiellaceae bacterium]